MSAPVPDRGQTPFATVVVATYNSAEYIESALLSLERQTLRDLEVVVVDDGSTDNTVEIVEHRRPAVKLVRQTNMGVAVARNHGISVSSGTWVAVLDADDLWGPTRLEEFAEYIRQAPDCRAIATDIVGFAAAEDLVRLRAQGEGPQIIAPRDRLVEVALRQAGERQGPVPTWTHVEILSRDDLLRYYPIRSPAFLLRRDTLMMAGMFQVSATGVSDLALALNIAAISPIHVMHHETGWATALYRLQPRSLSHVTDMGLLVLAQLATQHFGSQRTAGGANLDLLKNSSYHYRRMYIEDTLRYAATRRQWWRWHVALGLGYALMPDRASRVDLLRQAVRAAGRTVPAVRLLGRLARPRRHVAGPPRT